MRLSIILLIGSFSLFAAGDFSNRRAPGFSLSDTHFQQHDTQDYRGKVLIVDFIQTGCPICLHLTDVLLQVQAKYGDKVGVMSIVTLPDNFQTVDKFVADHKIPWPVLFDSGQVMASYLKVTPANPKVDFPHLFLIDGKGTIRNDYEPSEEKDLTVAAISAEIEKLQK